MRLFSASTKMDDARLRSPKDPMYFGQRDEASKPIRIAQLPSAFCHALIETSFWTLKNSENARQ
jgi:hypothetical protein